MTHVMVTLCITRFKISSFLIIIYCGEISYVNSLFSLHCYYYYKFETKESRARSKTILTCFFPSSHHFITSNFNQLRSQCLSSYPGNEVVTTPTLLLGVGTTYHIWQLYGPVSRPSALNAIF